jgi:glutathione synthase/RimK-type ligase-like ATP-grasp enzyme
MTRIWYNKSFSFVYAAINLIKQQDINQEFHLIASHTQAHARALLVAHEAHVEPSGLTGQAYVEWCLAFCQQHRVEVFVVGKEAQTIASYEQAFLAIGTRLFLVADADTLILMENKSQFAAQLPTEIAILPETITVTTASEFQLAYQQLRSGYRRVAVKPAISVFGLGFREIDEQRSCLQHILKGDEYIISLEELQSAMAKQPTFGKLLVMEFLDGDEWSVDCLADKGQLWVAVQRRKAMKEKGVPSQYIDNNPDIAAMCQRLTQHLHLSGQFNIQFREGQNGIRLLEINARPSGGMAMACLSGVNLPYMALKGFINGYETLPIPQIKTGIYVGEVSTAIVITN